MKLLLDTHIWIWNELEPWKIVSDVNREFANPENQMWLSPVSIWECVVLLERKGLVCDKIFEAGWTSPSETFNCKKPH